MISEVGIGQQTEKQKLICLSNLIKRVLQNDDCSSEILYFDESVLEELKLRIADVDSLKGWNI